MKNKILIAVWEDIQKRGRFLSKERLAAFSRTELWEYKDEQYEIYFDASLIPKEMRNIQTGKVYVRR